MNKKAKAKGKFTYEKNKKKEEPKVPYHHKPENLKLDEWQVALRRQFAKEQNFTIENEGEHPVFSDFKVYNPESGRTYKVAIRSEEPGLNYCSCPDFRINLLGTCKHIEWALLKLRGNKKNIALFKKGYHPYYSSISLRYGAERKIYLKAGANNHDEIEEIAKEYFDRDMYLKPEAFEKFDRFLQKAIALDDGFRFYQDAMDYIIEVRENNRRRQIIESKYGNGLGLGLDDLLKTKLYPYQKEGILFAAKAGRSLLADDMGLGKTIQAIGASVLMSRELGISRVLIVCPTSLKYQWKSEIEKFSDKDVLVLEGMVTKRKLQYASGEFFKIASYNSIKNDLETINKSQFDLVILDEAQRIKNWKTKTAINVKGIKTNYCIVLTGTPLENKLEELHSIVEFVDRYRLGAMFRFLHNHSMTDETGKVTGYTGLNSIYETIKPITLRRRKKEVLLQLPERTDKNFFVAITKEQAQIHIEYYDTVCRIVDKWRRMKFLSEADRQRLLLSLGCMRMVSDSTYILDQKTRFDTKVDEVMQLVCEILEQDDEKVVIFSQWERMTRLIAKELEILNIGYEYLHGGIPANKRKDLISNFTNIPTKRVFLSTDAGGVGLNLQAASNVINIDIPWNPAVLEQRIGRIHRMGQVNPVNVYNFISKGTIEERILYLLGFKKSMFEGVLDGGEDQVFAGDSKFKKLMDAVSTMVDETTQTTNEAYENSKEDVESISIEKEEPELFTIAEKPVDDNAQPASSSQASDGGVQSSNQGNAMQELLLTGISFLQKLEKSFSEPGAIEKKISTYIKKDEQTGQLNLQIPIKDEAVITNAFSAISNLLKAFAK